MKRTTPLAVLAAMTLAPAVVLAHAPSVLEAEASSPAEAAVLEDPTLSRAVGATISTPGEVDWYRMDLRAGDPLVVGMTAPDAEGALAASFVLVGPGLPDAESAGAEAHHLAETAGVDGAVAFEPLAEPRREVHAGLGFLDYGTLRLDTPVDGTYYVAVQAVDPDATGKYVLAPGVREEFGLDAISGMLELIAFFDAPWPPTSD